MTLVRDYELVEELDRLKGMTDAGRRAREFEVYLGKRFRREQFRVKMDPKGGAGRQIDLMAIGRDAKYLIEAKWTADKAGVQEIGDLALRLRKMPSDVFGVMVSWSGFAQTVATAVLDERPRQILLLTGSELERDQTLASLLEWKAQSLLEDGTVAFDEKSGEIYDISFLPDATTRIVNHDNELYQSLTTSGRYQSIVFVRELPDIDWVPGSGVGVAVDIRLPIFDEQELIGIVGKLHDLGWTTQDSWWSIRQASRNWHGCGTAEFTSVLSSWEKRYDGLNEIHHTEEFCYVDAVDTGFYSLSGQLSAEESRIARSLDLSIQLSGIPVRSGKVEELCKTFDVDEPVFYRPLGAKSVTRKHPIERVDLQVLGYVLQNSRFEADEQDREWVVGVVARNPYFGERDAPEWWPDNLYEIDQVICPLRSAGRKSGITCGCRNGPGRPTFRPCACWQIGTIPRRTRTAPGSGSLFARRTQLPRSRRRSRARGEL
jgi:hypothetical protein